MTAIVHPGIAQTALDAMPDPAIVYGEVGSVPDPEDYASPLWARWVLRVRADMSRVEMVAELPLAFDEWRLAGGVVAKLDRTAKDRYPSKDKATRLMGWPNPKAEALKEAVRSLGLALRPLAQQFQVGVPTVSRWVTGSRQPPPAFTNHINHLALARFGRSQVRVQGCWLALCGDELTPETVEIRLCQLWAEVYDLAQAGIDFSPLAQPLTPEEAERIDGFGDMPGTMESILDWYEVSGHAPVGVNLPQLPQRSPGRRLRRRQVHARERTSGETPTK